MITYYDLIVICKTGVKNLETRAYKFTSDDNCPIEAGKSLVEYVIERVKGEGMIPVCVIYLPYLAISKDMIKRLVFEVDILNMKCLWTAKGYCFENLVSLYSSS